ncbi:MAG: heavy-metal-associated domain-containing protein [Prolixibacteraceae bacterium]|nr:heavy-metal-associated domain-containing protein [Prolixibacteraceae bacterium]
MKSLTGIAAVLAILLISFSNKAFAAEKKSEKTLTFTVSMDCHACVQKIEGNIPYEKGVKDLKVSLDNKECTVTFRTDKTNEQDLIKAFNKLGYTAEVKKDKKEDKAQHGHGAGPEGHNNMEH